MLAFKLPAKKGYTVVGYCEILVKVIYLREDFLHRPLPEIKLISFDIETSGSLLGSGKVIEIGAVKFSLDGSIDDSFEQLIDPLVPIRPDYSRIHGITDHMVSGKPKIGEAVKKFLDFIDSDSILVAHNANFDVSFLSLEMARHSIDPPDNIVMDSLGFARKQVPGLKSYKLSSLSEQLGATSLPVHRALPDSLAVASIMVEISKIGQISFLSDLIDGLAVKKFHNGGYEEVDLPEHLCDIKESLKRGCSLIIRYRGGSKGSDPRLITPFFLVEREEIVYISAYCHLDGIEKSFRLDRVKEARLVKA